MRRKALDVAVTALLAATAGLAFHRVFPVAAIVAPILLSATVPAALTAVIAAIVAGRGRAVITALLVGLVAGTVVLVESTFPATTSHGLPTRASLVAVADGIVNGWLRILSVPAPARAVPGLLVVVPLLTWLAAQAGAAIAVWSDRPLRPALPSTMVFLLAVTAGVHGPGSNLPLAAGYAAVVALLLLLRHGGRPAAEQSGDPLPLTGRRIAGALGALTAGALACLLVGPQLPWAQARPPFDPRHLVHPPRQVESGMNPLDQIAGWLAQPSVPMFTVRSSAPDNLRLAVLDRFDGTRWTATERYGDLPAQIPCPAGQAVPTASVRTSVTLQGLPGAWLPAQDRPTSVSGIDARVATASAALMRPPSSDGPATYLVESRVPRYTAAALVSATPAANDAARWLPAGLPPQLAQDARSATGPAAVPFQQMVLLERWLRSHHQFDRSAAPGHSYASLAYFLGTSKRGTSEQFATAFAVMARSLGFPTRVVVGFTPAEDARPGQRFLVRSGDALAWPEVEFAGTGWVPFYPTPSIPHGASRPGPLAGGQSAVRSAIDEKAVLTKVAPKVDDTAGPPNRSSSHGPRWQRLLVLVGVGVIALTFMVVAAGVVQVRLRTRRRRTAARSHVRVLGAWREATEHVAALTHPPTRAMTAEEIAALPTGLLPNDDAARFWALAGIFNQSQFAAGAVTSAHADAAWRYADELTCAVRALLSWRQRLRLAVSRSVLRVSRSFG